MRRVAPAIALYFLSPFVAEFLLGDFPITMILLILPLSTMYGGGALFIRELTRRTGRGWPTILLLALAFGVVEEGLLTQSLFNPDYVGAHLLDAGFVPALGIAVPWTLFVLTIHTVWSIGAPIALVEEATGARREQPWLRTPGFVASIALFAAGCAAIFSFSYADGHFMAEPAQLAVAAVVAVALVVAAFLVPARTARGESEGEREAPGPWPVFAVAFGAGLVLFGAELPPIWVGVAVLVVDLAVLVLLVSRWSARGSWGAWHRFALAAAALLTYAWHAFFQLPVQGGEATLNLVTHIVFALVALAILGYAARRVRTHGQAS
ncbi:hypothetical protein [Catellatospora tritici]|uniref:hypothetical protein n=1 Tax=Catellatospora tritici TaxID=2851566 RepID=UPI001C2DED32|nr:hypothetical protein [Catellatospora tritici]MBV1853636.1 hypothetical protein [Catellatospora tritici]